MNETPKTSDNNAFLVVEIAKKQKRKRIRQLREGTGKLTEKVRDILDELREEGAIEANAQPVVIVVRQKPKRRGLFGG